jgi:hypothetical protein
MPPRLTRRAILAGGLALVVATGCGSDGEVTVDEEDGEGTTRSRRSLVAFFDGKSSLVPGSPQRAPFGVGDDVGALVRDVPDELVFTLRDKDGSPIGDPLPTARHAAGLPRAYYPVIVSVPAPGIYGVSTEIGGETIEAAFSVGRPEDVKVPAPGDAMPVTDTPTTADARAVDPICTSQPPCPLHDVNLRDALAGEKPTVLLVSTPAFCQTAICGPVLDVLVAERDRFAPQIELIHAEVYRKASEAEEKGASAAAAPVVEALNLTYEPCLVTVRADGTVDRRLDVIFDAGELREALTALVA